MLGVVNDEELYAKHRDELIRYATVLVGPSDAPDVLSAVITRLLKSRRRLADLREPRSYLMRAVLNESRNHRKRETGTAALTEIAVEPHRSDPDVLAAVIGLPRRQRAAVYLTYWGDMNSTEVAELMGCRPATVRRYLHLARLALQGAIHHG